MRWVYAGDVCYRRVITSKSLVLLLLVLVVLKVWMMGKNNGEEPPAGRDNARMMISSSQLDKFPVEQPQDDPASEEKDWYVRAAARQQKARQRLAEHCKGSFSTAMSKPTISPFFANSKHRVFYCICPKVASRALRAYFYTPQVGGKSYTLDRFQGFTNFMFVREPFHRLLSAYRNKIAGKDRLREEWLLYERKIIRKYRPDTPEGALENGDVMVTFKEFVGYIISDGLQDGFDWHWKPFEDICRPCDVRYDFIGRYEHLEDDVKFLKKLAKVQIENPFPPIRESKSDVELLDYYSTIPPEWILRLGKIYEADFKMFGYPFPGPLESLIKNHVTLTQE